MVPHYLCIKKVNKLYLLPVLKYIIPSASVAPGLVTSMLTESPSRIW